LLLKKVNLVDFQIWKGLGKDGYIRERRTSHQQRIPD